MPERPKHVTVDVRLAPNALRGALASDVRDGMTATPKRIPSTWFYDDRGSELFDEITRLAEYYPTRTERALLERHGAEMVEVAKADTLVELGSGTSEKTRILLDAFAEADRLERFVALDVSELTLRAAAASIAGDYAGVAVHAVVGDFLADLGALPTDGRRMVAFLGSTIGNLEPGRRAEFLRAVADGLDDGDTFLLATDLVKDPARLVAAYDDAAGITAAFNRNVLHVLNRELDANFVVEEFDHVARWNAEEEWIEMRLRARRAQLVHFGVLDLDVAFSPGEELLTEISAKFRPDRVRAELAAAGMGVLATWSDPAGDYLVTLAAAEG